MHFTIKMKLFDRLGAIGLKCTAVIMKVRAGGLANQPIGYFRRKPAQPKTFLAVHPPTANDIIPFLQLRQQQSNISRVVLKIAVKSYDRVPSGVVKPCHHSGCLPKIPSKAQNTYPFVLQMKLS